ncbi:Alpha,alpha-trehalase [Fibrella aestuarina BUZ 2]|uniref:Alpha,alpha-trehalase n=1 Tax=Fibrella aestuarina BUZ 2 TaxID=1166018 RepID=I0K363_9BACT|nr:alpha,alpha-trehalase TreF [Fibrella aestuarina]CCG98566.1 Alpha,alpha-trehalase [Fibrella aestuarina BUZ 2]
MSLFHDVQMGRVFPDQKTFVDCIPNENPAEVEAAYEAARQQPDFELSTFVLAHFTLPERPATDYVSDTRLTTAAHIDRLWERLTRPADVPVPHDSRVALPHPYVVPGGRFREIFYWDSYFTMLGLRESGRTDLIRDMIDNFAYLIDTVGFIPNGNRTYFLSRSQPPFFGLMVQLLAHIDGPAVLTTYLPQLEKEYAFWMHGADALSADKRVGKRVVRLPNGAILNRHWDPSPTPRPESYRQELELTPDAQELGTLPETLYTHIRAACESGWDFSSRWFTEEQSMATIRAADIIPVDLNCLLYTLEQTLARAYASADNTTKQATFEQAATNRQALILTTFWNAETGFFHDYAIDTNELTPSLTLAAAFPLFCKLATPEQAAQVHERLKADFLQAGGWVTTLCQSGQQWDWPNGWAPLQWIVYKGLLNYSFAETAHEGRDNWVTLNDKVFRATGKMMEKYNVVDAALTTGGGEYPNQDGFGWTNGVYLALTTGGGEKD